MKEINLISIIDSHKNIPDELFKKYLKYYSVKIKDSEIEDLEKFVNELKKINSKISNFEMFFLGFIIPQISKEFDLLRFDNDSVLNIEIKRESSTDKIKRFFILPHFANTFSVRRHFIKTVI